MYLLGVLYVVGLTVALPVLPDPPKLSYSVASAHQNQKFYMNTPKVDASSPVRKNNKEVNKDTVKIYPVVIPPPPELPPSDYSILIKQKAQKNRFDAGKSKVERFVVVKDIKPIEKPVEVAKKEFKPIENSKFEEEVQLNEESKPLEEPTSVEEPKSVEELIPIEEFSSAEEPKAIEDPIYEKEPKPAEEPVPIQESTYVEEPKSVEEHKPAGELIPIDEFTYVEEFKSTEAPIYVTEPKPAEEPVPIKESTYVEEPKPVEEHKSAVEPKPVEQLDSSKLEPKEEPEKEQDIPVVIQFSIPTTTFLSSIISKLPSLASFGFGWPFHKPSIFNRPRLIDPNYLIIDMNQ